MKTLSDTKPRSARAGYETPLFALRPLLVGMTLGLFILSARAGLADDLIPAPQSTHDATGTIPSVFTAAPMLRGVAPDAPALRVLHENFSSGPSLPVTLAVDISSGIRAEGYRMTIAPVGITVTASDNAGLFYAMQTLRQLAKLAPNGIAAGDIEDAPAFAIRGLMHDTGRNFRTVAELKADLDRLAAYKLNTFHWHLTDNPAWRIECKAYPQLNDKKSRQEGRDPGSTYSYDDIRDLIRHAKSRHIRVIPELDMPGHSAYFTKTFGFAMGDPRALPILKKLIAEFCAEIPKEDCPVIHIGSDEVHIKDPKKFIREIASTIESFGRTPMIWNPGLPNDGRCISQLWAEPGSGRIGKEPNAGIVDSGLGYLNLLQPSEAVRRYFFVRTCGLSHGDAKNLGGILCLWPDVRVDDKAMIAAMSPQWPGTLAFAENTWHGRPLYAEAKRYAASAPKAGTPAYAEYTAFENRLARHRDAFFAGVPFPFVKNVRIPWKISGALPGEASGKMPDPDDTAGWKLLQGGETLLPLSGPDGADSKTPGSFIDAVTTIVSERPKTIRAFVGFETPGRSNRKYGGIPEQGRRMGGNPGAIAALFVNDGLILPPKWKNPGKYFNASDTWGRPAEEIPYEAEEFYWLREPDTIELKAGKNIVTLRIPCRQTVNDSTRGFAFMPVKRDPTGRWIEDESVVFE